MTPKVENLIERIFRKFKNYKTKEIALKKEDLEKFIYSLFEES